MDLSFKKKTLIACVLVVLFIFILYFVSEANYLFYHNFVEFFSIVIAFVIFTIAWHTRKHNENNYLLLLGSAYFFIGILDFVHSLSYEGMGVFSFASADVPTQLWISARYLEAFTLFLAPLLLGRRKLDMKISLLGYGVVTFVLMLSIFYFDIFPTTYIQGEGLTVFKKASEYLISLVLIIAIYFLYQNREHFEKNIFYTLTAAIIFTIFGELSFTFYESVYGFSNFLGHLFKLFSFYFIYRALVLTTMKKPYAMMYRRLKDTKDELEQIIEGMNDAVYLHDTHGNLIKVNEAAQKEVGYSIDELLDMNVRELDRKDFDSRLEEKVKELKLSGNAKFRSVHVTKNDEEVPVEVNSTLLKYKNRDVVLSVVRDITERVEAQEKLRKSKKFLQESIDSILANIVIIDENGEILKVNKRWKEFADNNDLSWDDYGIGHNYLGQVKASSGDSSEGSDAIYEGIKEVINGSKEVFYHEYPCHSPEEKRWFMMTASRFTVESQIRVIISHVNITERKMAEQELKLKENAIEYSINAMAIVDEKGCLSYVNRSFLSMWGYDKKDEIIGKYATDVWNSSTTREILEKLKSRGIWTGEMRVNTRDGENFTVQVLASTFKEGEGNSEKIIASFVDITQRKRKEKELKKALQDLKESNQELKETQEKLSQANKMAAIGQLAGGVAHELNNPMTAVSIYSDMLLNDLKEEEFECTDENVLNRFSERMETMKSAADRCKEITDNLLRFSRKSGEEFVDVKVENVVENTFSLLGKKLEDENIDLDINLDEDLPIIEGNPKQLQQVFTNIILNAEDAIEDDGQIEIEAKIKKDEIEIKFTDNGEGIEKEDVEKIFEPFYTTKAPGEGTGLGLSISYRIINDHDGDIKVESEKGKGTTFRIFLPIKK